MKMMVIENVYVQNFSWLMLLDFIVIIYNKVIATDKIL